MLQQGFTKNYLKLMFADVEKVTIRFKLVINKKI